MRSSWLGFSMLSLRLLVGCNDDGGGPAPIGSGGSSAGLGNGGGSGEGERGGSAGEAGGDGGALTEDLSELRALEACSVPEPCGEPDAFVQLIEGMTHNIHEPSVRCLLRSLADRRPGRYVHRTDSTYGNGSTAALHVFVVADDGSVAYVRDPTQYTSSPESVTTVLPPDPAQRCTLKPASYFEACLAAVESTGRNDRDPADPAWLCTFGDGAYTQPSRLDWFESCEPESPPRCESGSAPIDAGAQDAGGADDARADAAH